VLTKRGYNLYRPTVFERSILRSTFRDWFGEDIATFARTYAGNREALARVKKWARAEDLASSLWRYGVPEQWDTGQLDIGETGLNEIESEITYTDLIAFICSKINDLRYLEIGVSVGKNFYQICRQFPKGRLVGLDIEMPNPVLQEALGVNLAEHSTGIRQLVDSLSGQKKTVELSTYSSDNITYLRGNQLSNDTWSVLNGQNFNFIFSDGVHSPDALNSEFEFLTSHELIDTSGPFVMYWDDLVNFEMQNAFNQCASRLKEIFSGGWHGLHWIHGTYGSRRLNGLFVNGLANFAS